MRMGEVRKRLRARRRGVSKGVCVRWSWFSSRRLYVLSGSLGIVKGERFGDFLYVL